MEKLLIVEDDLQYSQYLSELLTPHGWLVETAANGLDGLQLLDNFRFDFILLDWELPDVSGIDFCKRYRATGGQTPIVFVTARRDIEDKEMGLDAGGDDYITKPFDVRELLARIRTVKRRPHQLIQNTAGAKGIHLDVRLRVASKGDRKARLSATECSILEFFLSHRNEYFNAARIFAALWPSDSEASDRTVKVQMNLLRKKLVTLDAEDLIETVKGSGYILQDDSSNG